MFWPADAILLVGPTMRNEPPRAAARANPQHTIPGRAVSKDYNEHRPGLFRVRIKHPYHENREPAMNRRVRAEYLAEEQKLKLDEPLEGVKDGEKVRIAIESGLESLAGSLSAEAGRELAAAVKDAFGRDEIEV